MSSIYIFRFAFSEVCSMAAVLFMLFTILPCRRSKVTACIIAYAGVLVYLAFMLGMDKSVLGDGIWVRPILLITEQFILPCYLIGDRMWYRYVGLVPLSDGIAACMGSILFTPIYYFASGGGSTFNTEAMQYEMYENPGTIYILVVYLILNFISYYILTKILLKLMENAKRKKYILNISLIFFIIQYIALNFIYIRQDSFFYANIACFVMLGVGLFCLVRGIIWEKTDAEKNRRLAEIREKIQYEKYTYIQNNYDKARRILHDLTDHMLTMQLLLENENIERAKEYIKEVNIKY